MSQTTFQLLCSTKDRSLTHSLNLTTPMIKGPSSSTPYRPFSKQNWDTKRIPPVKHHDQTMSKVRHRNPCLHIQRNWPRPQKSYKFVPRRHPDQSRRYLINREPEARTKDQHPFPQAHDHITKRKPLHQINSPTNIPQTPTLRPKLLTIPQNPQIKRIHHPSPINRQPLIRRMHHIIKPIPIRRLIRCFARRYLEELHPQ